MENNGKISNSSIDEISIERFIKEIIGIIIFIFKRWYFVILGAVFFGFIQYRNISKVNLTYPAKIKLYIKPQDISDENKLLLQSYVQIINSRNLLEKILFNEVEIDGVQVLVINEYLNTYYKYNPDGLNGEIPNGFQFENRILEELDLEELMFLNVVLDKMTIPKADYSDGFISVSSDYELGFITINISTPASRLSLLVLNELYKEAKLILLENTGFAYDKAYFNLKEETDSLSGKYKEIYYQLNLKRDQRIRLLKADSIVSNEVKYLEKQIYKLEVDAEIHKIQYLAALESLKITQVDMDQKSLLLRELERTHSHIKPYQPSVMVESIKWAIMGSIISIFLITVFRIFINVKKELSI